MDNSNFFKKAKGLAGYGLIFIYSLVLIGISYLFTKDEDNKSDRPRYNELNPKTSLYPIQADVSNPIEIEKHLQKAWENKELGDLNYALFEARKVLENIIKGVILGSGNPLEITDSTYENINICKRDNLLEANDDFYSSLQIARKKCNANAHEYNETGIKNEDVTFVLNTVQSLFDCTKLKKKN